MEKILTIVIVLIVAMSFCIKKKGVHRFTKRMLVGILSIITIITLTGCRSRCLSRELSHKFSIFILVMALLFNYILVINLHKLEV